MNKIAKWIALLFIIGLVPVLGWWLHYIFSLPAMGYTPNGIVISNCDDPWDENASLICPQLFCKKKIIESKRIHGRYSLIEVEDIGDFEKRDATVILTGKIKYADKTSADAVTHYKCFMKGDNVLKYELLSEEEWNRPILNGSNKIIRLWKGGICFSAEQKEKDLADLLKNNNIKYWAGNNASNKKEYCVSWPPSEESKVKILYPTYKETKQACDESPVCRGRI